MSAFTVWVKGPGSVENVNCWGRIGYFQGHHKRSMPEHFARALDAALPSVGQTGEVVTFLGPDDVEWQLLNRVKIGK